MGALEAAAHTALAERGMTGRIVRIGNRFQFRGEIGTKGCAVDIEGEPDQALLRQAAGIMRDRIESEWR